MTPRAILLPGSVLPAEPAYSSLIGALGSDADVVAKDLEVYATEEVPSGYDLDLEVAGVEHEAAARGWEQFHLVGYSGGGAAALAVVARHPERLSSLALLEPAWAGRWDLSPAEQSVWREFDQLEKLPPDEFLSAFMSLNVMPGVKLPQQPSGEALRGWRSVPAGSGRYEDIPDLRSRSRCAGKLRSARLLRARRTSNSDQYREIATRLSGVFPDFQLEVFEERHHFDPPHRIEPERLADSLRALWNRADGREPPP